MAMLETEKTTTPIAPQMAAIVAVVLISAELAMNETRAA